MAYEFTPRSLMDKLMIHWLSDQRLDLGCIFPIKHDPRGEGIDEKAFDRLPWDDLGSNP